MRGESGKETSWSRTSRSWKILTEIHARRLNAREVLMHGTAKLSARDQLLRRPNSIRDHPARGESDGSQPREPQTNDIEARNDFWTISGSFFVVLTLYQELHSTVPNGRVIPDTTRMYWRCQTVKYDIGCFVRESHWRLLEHWWWSGPLSRRSQYWMETSRWHMWSWRRLTKKSKKRGPTLMTRDLILQVANFWTKRKTALGYWKTEARRCQEVSWGHLLHRIRWHGVQGHQEKKRAKMELPMESATPCKV